MNKNITEAVEEFNSFFEQEIERTVPISEHMDGIIWKNKDISPEQLSDWLTKTLQDIDKKARASERNIVEGIIEDNYYNYGDLDEKDFEFNSMLDGLLDGLRANSLKEDKEVEPTPAYTKDNNGNIQVDYQKDKEV